MQDIYCNVSCSVKILLILPNFKKIFLFILTVKFRSFYCEKQSFSLNFKRKTQQDKILLRFFNKQIILQ